MIHRQSPTSVGISKVQLMNLFLCYNLIGSENMETICTQSRNKAQIILVKASVVTMSVDAIVNAANSSLLGGGGVDGAIHRAAGAGLLKECRSLHGCRTGEAKITGAYNIKNARYIIHTVGPIYSAIKEDEDHLRSCYINSLDLALKHHCTSIAFPGISTGVYGYPIQEASAISYQAICDWIDKYPDIEMAIYLCGFRDQEVEAYQKIMKA